AAQGRLAQPAGDRQLDGGSDRVFCGSRSVSRRHRFRVPGAVPIPAGSPGRRGNLVVDQMSMTDSSNGRADQDRKWYVIHTYSGYENKVKTNLEHRIESMGVQDKIFQVVIPTEEEIEIKDGQRRTVQEKVYPGYVMVEMAMDEDAWYVVRNTPGVSGFVV